ncbi:patatin-like phospholipase family protein [Ancylobacter sp. Lp-2]|uniref:patatin-like phospholipase family protein n=1 Tax=Ancylobacter sp. Lp-2 TaxID=2881339 RepID=UPI001E4BBBC2|nr:patatin-like phospholipase family protein [Ancylobacter sp. Lp-2]MCB4767991.1 patatin-like phospholipase family protein [Ancylobacter sp. Lp-2]
MAKLKVAIACQGGGSHAAFAAGLLRRLLLDEMEHIDIRGLSGTSGGAICAALAWAGLIQGRPEEGADRLMRFWEIAKADTPVDYAANLWGQWLGRAQLLPETSPYRLPAPAAAIMRDWLEETLDIPGLPTGKAREAVKLLVGATDVLSGARCIFTGEHLAYDDLIASAAIPTLYEAVETRGRFHWDGLFSVNPPIRNLVFLDIDELWVVQINPTNCARVPMTMGEIIDRRNELSGNVALAQELHLVETVNDVVRSNPGVAIRNRHNRVMREIPIRLVEAGLDAFDYVSKLDRTPQFIDDLLERGWHKAPLFRTEEAVWPRRGAVQPRAITVSGPSSAQDQASQQPAAASAAPAAAPAGASPAP